MDKYKRLDEDENSQNYVNRIKDNFLPNWPDEVIISWLWWGNGLPSHLSTLPEESLSFTKEIWGKERIPGQNVFHSSWDFEEEKKKLDYWQLKPIENRPWLVNYMWENGTWNTGIILLKNESKDLNIEFLNEKMNKPYHLLEGHNRLSLLNRLIELDRALDKHEIWVAEIKH